MNDREDLRKRFVKAESTLFRIRYDSDDRNERDAFLSSRDFDWISVSSTLPSCTLPDVKIGRG
jgi:hypothetical protein